ncbi:hypothetical protein LTR09_002114 [Extremus antarcticus]|uniref:Uncharacterized protein n=1 Tax=Extremus antarcticus TaxID=702011 RepID=A0AAJ0LVQ5_9PEZI|nr:hypothetical protein LTR09_002114 [Extremus antarcticus]
MLRAESPASLLTTGSEAVSRPSERHHENHRPSYRLFPAVEPTPPQSPQSLQKNRLKRASDYHKKRAISLDESARAVVARHNAPDRSTPVNRVKKGHLAGINSMSTLQESPVDSPTVPFAYGALYRTSEEDRSRSSSAPGEYIRDSQTLPTRGSVWTSKQADSHAGGAPMGLGLSMPVSRLAERPPTRQGPHKIRPPLTIEIKKLEDRPPPPPPKSPRHARTPSVQSGVSSMHGESPSSGAVATPGSLMRGTLVDA